MNRLYRTGSAGKAVLAALSILFLVSLLYLIDFLALNGFPARLSWTCRGAVVLPLLSRLLFIDYLWFFTFLLFLPGAFILVYLFLFLRRRLKFASRAQVYVFTFWVAVILYYAWFISLKITTVPALPNWLIYPLFGGSVALLCLVYLGVKKNPAPGKLFRDCAAVFVTLLLFRVAFSFVDAAFFTPITGKNLPAVAIGLVVLCIACLGAYFPLSRLIRVFLKEKNLSKLFFALVTLAILSLSGIAVCGFLVGSGAGTLRFREIVSRADRDNNALLIVVDALRADHLGCYGYRRDTSPAIDALAGEGVLFQHCYTQASWTKPSIASLITSLYPTMHGTSQTQNALPESAVTLGEMLQVAGYITYGLVNNPVVTSQFNFHQGYDFFDDYQMEDKIYESALRYVPYSGVIKNILVGITGRRFDFFDRDDIRSANKRIMPWLARYRDQDFFMFLHFLDPHSPYSPPPPYNRMYPYVKGDKPSRDIALYDGEIRFVDDHIKEIFDQLKSWGEYDKTLIVLTSDHGEAFGEHGDFGHGHTIYQEQLRVPLIIKFPDGPKGEIIRQQVRSIDILPTILQYLGVKTDSKLAGISLMEFLKGEEQSEPVQEVFIEQESYKGLFSLKGIIWDNRWKLIVTEKSGLRNIERDGAIELYDLDADPEETNNILPREAGIAETMKEMLIRYRHYSEENRLFSPQTEVSREIMQQIRALGYM